MIGVANSSLHLLLLTGLMFFCLLTTGPAFRVQQAQTLSAPTSTALGVTAGATQATSVSSSTSTDTGAAKPDSVAASTVPREQLNALLNDINGTLVKAMPDAGFANVVESLCQEFPYRDNIVASFLRWNAGRFAAVMAESLTPQCIVKVIAQYSAWNKALSNGLSDAELVEIIQSLCEILDGDQSDGQGDTDMLQFVTLLIHRFTAMVKASAAPPCLVHMVALLMTRGKIYSVRQFAKKTLQELRDAGASEAGEFLAKWDEAQQRAVRRFEQAVNGSLVRDPEALALASRFYDSPWVVRQTSEVRLPSNWKQIGSSLGSDSWRDDARYGILTDFDVAVLRRDMTDLECAQACVYATELPSKSDIDRLFVKPYKIFAGCRTYVLLGGRTCLFSAEQFSSDQVSPAGAGRIRNFPTPAAVDFCVAAKKQKNLTVAACQATLTAQYASAGAAQVGALGRQQVLKHICAAECQSLVRAVTENDPKTRGGGSISYMSQTWCTVDVVQLVEAHNLQCCGSACGWDAGTKTCAGIGLLSKVTQEEWFAECCSPSAVMLGSDRDYMCRSASQGIWNKIVSPQKEPPSGALEAFKRGEDIAPNFDGTGPPSGCVTVPVGPSTTSSKVVGLPGSALRCSTKPANKQDPTWTESFAIDVLTNTTIRVRRADDARSGWKQPLELSCCRTTSSLTELGASGSQQPRATDIFQVSPCALTCVEPTFMKSSLLQCSASSSREWVTVNEGVQTCPQAGFMQSQKKKSPAACKEFGVLIPGATHASWQFLPGDKSDEQPHQGRCSLYRNCGAQDRIMWTRAKAQMKNDTEVLWSRLRN